MAEISKITLPSGNTYNLKDSVAREEIAQLVKAGLVYVKADVLPTASDDTLGKIYLIPHNNGTNNTYDEYITINNGTEASPIYAWEKIGSTDIDLSGYALKGDGVTVGGTTASATTGISISNHTVTQGTTSSTLYYTTDEVYGTGTTATVPAYKADRSYIGATASGTAVNVTSSSDAITGFGTHPSDTFLKSYAGSTAKLATTSITGTNGTVSIPNVTANETVSATKISSYGTLPTLTTTVANETLTIGFSQGSLPTGSDVSATNTTLGTAITAAKVASSATTVATGKTASSDSSGDTIMTGLGTATTASAITGLGTATTETFAKSVGVSAQPTITLATNTASATGRVQLATNISTDGTNSVTFGTNDKVTVVKTVSGTTSTGASSTTISGTNSGIGVSAHSITDNGHVHEFIGTGTIDGGGESSYDIYYQGERAVPCFTTKYQFNGKSAGTLTQGDKDISIAHTGTASGTTYSVAHGTSTLTDNAIDLTNYTKYGIHISGGNFGNSAYDNYQKVYAFVTDTKGASTSSNRLKSANATPRTGTNDLWIWVDISELTGEHYLGFGLLSDGGGLSYDITAKIDQVSLVV